MKEGHPAQNHERIDFNMTKKKATATLAAIKAVFKEAKRIKRPYLMDSYTTWNNYVVFTDSFNLIATTAPINLENMVEVSESMTFTKWLTIDSMTEYSTATIPSRDEIKNAVDTLKAEGHKEIIVNICGTVTLNAFYLLNALKAIDTDTIYIYDTIKPIMIKDDDTKAVILPIVHCKIEKKKMTYEVAKPDNYIYINSSGEIEIRRTADTKTA